jgi:alkanesulfonate monooxygenase SsuD/methylene tetrahydromethanopterin reductase-like flavin-dependent oxidoreductase (luciferase family)
MRSIFFTMMSYPELPEPDETYSSWVTPQQKWWDAQVGNAVYNKYLNELEYADAVGFDAIGMNEHHNCAYTMMPSPNLWAASVARRTENAAIAVLGNTLTTYNSPIRVAEEMAMLDAVSGGRLISGFVPGTTMDTAYANSVNPSQVRQRFMEAADLIVRAWTADEPFEFNGRFHQLRYVDPWPRVVQDPHPPIWLPAGGSPETWEFAAARGYVYAYLTFGGLQQADKLNHGYWETVKRLGREPNPFSLAANQFVFVADSMKEAEELYGPCIDYFWQRVMRFDPRFAGAPGYLSEAAVRMSIGSAMADAAKGAEFEASAPGGNDPDMGSGKYSFRSMVDQGVLIAGSPDEVTERLIANATKYRIGNLVLNMAMGNMSEEVTKHNIKMYADHVMPNIRPIFEDEWDHEWWPKPLPNRVPMAPLQADVVAKEAGR